MRISGGKAGGVTLRVSKKSVHRPAMDRLRQSLFSSLGERVIDAHVCDLFAGTGSYGLEALSRGAASATFLESNKRACAIIRQNIAIVTKSMGQPRLDATVLPLDVTRWQGGGQAFDLVFVDPPYDLIESVAPDLFALFDRILAPDGLVAFEAPGHLQTAAPNWTLLKRLGKPSPHQPTACLYARA